MRSFLLLPLLLCFAACTGDTADTPSLEDTVAEGIVHNDDHLMADLGTVVGEDPGDGAVLFANEVAARADQYAGAPVRVAGTVAEVCQAKGCWLTLQNNEGVAFRVNVPRDENGEYVFTFPMDISGRQAVLAGMLTIEETDVETLRHLAEDGGATEEEVAAITEPEKTLVLTATGARLEGEA